MTTTSHRTLLGTVLVLLVTVCTARAQTISALADVSKRTHRGDTLRVHHMDGRRTTGDLREISIDGVLLDVDGMLVSIPAAEVRELGVTSDSLKNGALIGLATGAVVGMFAATSGSSGDGLVDAATAGPAALMGIVAGGAAGVGIGIGLDALVRRYRVLYKAPVHVTPITTSRGGYGMAFGLSW